MDDQLTGWIKQLEIETKWIIERKQKVSGLMDKISSHQTRKKEGEEKLAKTLEEFKSPNDKSDVKFETLFMNLVKLGQLADADIKPTFMDSLIQFAKKAFDFHPKIGFDGNEKWKPIVGFCVGFLFFLCSPLAFGCWCLFAVGSVLFCAIYSPKITDLLQYTLFT